MGLALQGRSCSAFLFPAPRTAQAQISRAPQNTCARIFSFLPTPSLLHPTKPQTHQNVQTALPANHIV